ncbi:MAG: hypothetical protein WCK81_12195, partial [Betaproteobacteria bacterium]
RCITATYAVAVTDCIGVGTNQEGLPLEQPFSVLRGSYLPERSEGIRQDRSIQCKERVVAMSSGGLTFVSDRTVPTEER